MIRAFLDWVARLHGALTDAEIAQAVVTGSTSIGAQVVQAVPVFSPGTGSIAEREAQAAAAELERQVGASMRLTLTMRDPNFARAAEEHEARLVREVTAETRRGISNTIVRAYRQGLHPYDVAPTIRGTVGLTARQANAVLTYSESLRKKGVRPDVVSEQALRYAARMRARRAKTIARTETVRAATMGRLASYDHAAASGLFDMALAEIEWSSVQADPMEICAQLNGTRVPLGATFDGLLPPAHPNCRCAVHLVIGK